MLFTSWQFMLVFLPAAWGIFFLIPARLRTARKVWLTLASLFFYGYWRVEYVPLLLLSLGVNYTAAEWITRRRGHPAASWILIAGVGIDLLLLGYYKYTNFIAQALGLVTGRETGHFDIILPLAISFFTFTQIAYLVDVSRDPKLHYGFLDYALFVVFFPHLIAGPIVRHWEIIPQYAAKDLQVDRTDLGTGLAFFLAGLFKKILLADPAAVYANAIYGAASSGATLSTFDAWFGTLAFALQIYFDFSGYSDMAIGLARLFSIRFPSNFNSPYQAGNIAEFWRRWHMTLTRFLRDYVYFPLGGSRCGPWARARNLVVTFALSGLWHGAGWTYLCWGLLHGCYLVVRQQWALWQKRRAQPWSHWTYRGACVLITFIAVLVAWVYFRAPNLPVAHRVVASMFGYGGVTVPETLINPAKPAGRTVALLRVRITAGLPALKSYDDGLELIGALLLLVWFFPNTQQLLRAYAPVLELESVRPSRWSWRLRTGTGLAMGALLFLVVRSNYAAPPSPFLYFNF